MENTTYNPTCYYYFKVDNDDVCEHPNNILGAPCFCDGKWEECYRYNPKNITLEIEQELE